MDKACLERASTRAARNRDGGCRLVRSSLEPVPPPSEESRGTVLTVDISLPEIEELHKLVQEGLDKGVLTYDEIVQGLEEVDLTKEQVEDFYTYLI